MELLASLLHVLQGEMERKSFRWIAAGGKTGKPFVLGANSKFEKHILPGKVDTTRQILDGKD